MGEREHSERWDSPPMGEPGWRPYCLMCGTMARMVERPYGFQCDPDYTEPALAIPGHVPIPGRRGCGNRINHDLTHYDPPASQVEGGDE